MDRNSSPYANEKPRRNEFWNPLPGNRPDLQGHLKCHCTFIHRLFLSLWKETLIMGSIPREFARPGGNSIKLDPHILAGYYPPIPLIPPVGGQRRY